MHNGPMPVDEPEFAAGDRGKGSFRDYAGLLVPRSARVRLRLAGSDPAQELLRDLLAEGDPLETAIPRRSREDEAVDAAMPVRLFANRRVTDVVGWVPRGMEAVVDEAIARLETLGRPPRIPAEIVRTRGRLRVELRMGHTRP